MKEFDGKFKRGGEYLLAVGNGDASKLDGKLNSALSLAGVHAAATMINNDDNNGVVLVTIEKKQDLNDRLMRSAFERVLLKVAEDCNSSLIGVVPKKDIKGIKGVDQLRFDPGAQIPKVDVAALKSAVTAHNVICDAWTHKFMWT